MFIKKSMVFAAGLLFFLSVSVSAQDDIPIQCDNVRIPPGYRIPVALDTGDNEIDSLVSGSKWSGSTITFSFYSDSEFNGTYYGSQGVHEVAEITKTHCRNIFARLNQLLDVTFVEVAESYPSTYGKIRIMLSDDPDYAYAYYPSGSPLGGDVHLGASYDNDSSTNGWRRPPGNHGYMSMIHEIGHALGLKHPHDGSPQLITRDNSAWTVMSYNFKGNSAGTHMVFDIKALQSIYGSSGKRPGDSEYSAESRVDLFKVDGVYMLNDYASYNYKQTIYDTGGIDTLDFSDAAFKSSGYRFDLRPRGLLIAQNEYHVDSNGKIGEYFDWGSTVAEGQIIENLVNSGSDDSIYLNSANNIVMGYNPSLSTGDDVIYFASASDTLRLEAYDPADVDQAQAGDDLVLSLDGMGTITLIDYYLGASHRPAIDFTVASPEIDVLSNGVSIASGDISPSAGDNTLFKRTVVNKKSSNNTYIIENTGSQMLGIYGVSLSGADAGDFSVSVSPAGAVAIGGSTVLEITFSPQEEGIRNATVSIYNDDANENPYFFSIQGEGSAGVYWPLFLPAFTLKK